MIRKMLMVHKCCLYEIGSHVILDSTYVKPEHIHHWVGRDYAADNKNVLITKIWVSPERHKELFPND